MIFNETFLINFIKDISIFDEKAKKIIDEKEKIINTQDFEDKKEWQNFKENYVHDAIQKGKNIGLNLKEYYQRIQNISQSDLNNKQEAYTRMQKCKATLALIRSSENSIIAPDIYRKNSRYTKYYDFIKNEISAEDICNGRFDFCTLALELNKCIRKNKKHKIRELSSTFYYLCRGSEKILNDEINIIRNDIVKNIELLHNRYDEEFVSSKNASEKIINDYFSFIEDYKRKAIEKERNLEEKNIKIFSETIEKYNDSLRKLENEFIQNYEPNIYEEEYDKMITFEPSYDSFSCCTDNSEKVHLSSLEIDITDMNLAEYTRNFLIRYYHFLYKYNKLSMPYSISFMDKANYIFRFKEALRAKVVKDACAIGLRLFMMLPPGKIRFIFIDPVKLGESFAIFNQLVDVDDRTSEIINGKIWSSSSDIDEKLRITTDYISNVTQRYLQGKYDNIYEYNRVAEKNAEPYQILMYMDYPAGLSEQSAKLLEQIVSSGPKCGVFSFIFRNESQYLKTSERLYPLISNIETGFKVYEYLGENSDIVYQKDILKNKALIWKELPTPDAFQMENIIGILKKGIKKADKVTIDIDKVRGAEVDSSTKNGIRIPIGIRGANDIQYLTLGVGGSHHALVAGITRSGKSSLLHTIILQALNQYRSPDELSIYLIDFKRGVEFQIYADFLLPVFKVIAIETEREFGYNILMALEREQKVRADIFKRAHVDKIEEYRDLPKENQKNKMPRILVIMDEFHELFYNNSDEIGRKSSEMIERIVRQGAAFGIHLILSSQSYSNISGIAKAVYDQMAVRIVLKCSKADADLLLENGGNEVDQISIDDPGRAIYNSEAGNKEYNSHFRVAYIDPANHRDLLREISNSSKQYYNNYAPTRVLLSNIEDNNFCIFNQFQNIRGYNSTELGKLYIGESLSLINNMIIELTPNEGSNLLLVGDNTEKARSMFAFAILSLCINYWLVNRTVPQIPFITLFNCKPLNDSYFPDTPKLLADLLPEYVSYISCGETKKIQEVVSELYENIIEDDYISKRDRYFFVFGYQRAEELKSDNVPNQIDDANNIFNLISNETASDGISIKEMFRTLMRLGPQKGVHTILWQDSFSALEQDDKEMMSYFSMKIAFDMMQDEFSRFISANNVGLMNDNNAIYYNKFFDNQKFRPYQSPNEEWLRTISEKLK